MKKINVLWIILDLIFLIIFNTIFFMAGGTEHSASVWLSYGFIHFAYLLLILTPYMVRKSKSSAVFGFTLFSITPVYFLIQLVVGIIFIFVFPEKTTTAFLIQLCIAGLYGIILISNLLANEHTANSEEKRQNQIAYVKEASIKLKGLIDQINDKEAKKKIEAVYDTVYSSPVKSHPNLADIENRIIHSINALQNEVYAGNKENIITLANSLFNDINERNMHLRTMN